MSTVPLWLRQTTFTSWAAEFRGHRCYLFLVLIKDWMRIVPSDISFSKSELLLTGLEEKGIFGVKCFLQRIKLHLKTVIYPSSFLFYFIYCYLKLLVETKMASLKWKRPLLACIHCAVVLAVGGILCYSWGSFPVGDIAKWVRKVLSMLDLVLRGLFCHSPKFLYVQSLRVHRSESSIDLGGGNIKKKGFKR